MSDDLKKKKIPSWSSITEMSKKRAMKNRTTVVPAFLWEFHRQLLAHSSPPCRGQDLGSSIVL